ncbi:hypothetical protein N9P28_03130 [Schleiferiaceae bacterium]|nr:hypothetical protein [Schleiferiaceae bacterium]
MSLNLNKDNDYLLIEHSETSWSQSDFDGLKELLDAEEGTHVILDLSACNAIASIDTLQNLQGKAMGANQSFIILVALEQLGQFDEDIAVVPSMTEAIDWFEMEDMERQLMAE